jgi:hypothetical protein
VTRAGRELSFVGLDPAAIPATFATTVTVKLRYRTIPVDRIPAATSVRAPAL